MKNALLTALLAALVGLTGCGDDKPANNVPAPTPENSGVKGPPPKDPSIKDPTIGGEKGVGGRQIPGGKVK